MKRLSQFCIAAAGVGLVTLLVWRSVPKPDTAAAKASMKESGREASAVKDAAQTQQKLRVQPAPVVLKPVSAVRPAPMLAFDQWTDRYLAAGPGQKGALVEEGLRLAKARQEEMLRLFHENPEAAYKNAISYEMRKAVPQEIASFFEKQISAEGKLTPLFYVPLPGHENEVPPTEFRAEINKEKYLAFPYGAYKRFTLPHDLPFQGIAIGKEVVVSSEVIREVGTTEKDALIKDGLLEVDAQKPIVGMIGSKPMAFASRTKMATAAKALQQSIIAPPRAKETPPPGGLGTQGRRELLLIPVTFADDPRPPITQDAAEQALRANNQYFVEGSYGNASFFSTVTPPMALPQRKVFYGEFLDQALFSDAVAAAAAAGYDVGQYGYIYVIFNPIPGVNFGGRSDGLLNGSVGSITHELGHNFGLGHANYWDVSGTTPGPTNNLPVDRDSEVGHSDVNAPFRLGMVSKKVPIEEYGNIYEVMGSGGGHFSAWAKWSMNWLPDQFVRRVRTCETNRIYTFDTPHIQPGRLYALRVHKDYSTDFTGVPNGDVNETDRSYWISHREGFDNNPFMEEGVEVIWNSMLLDTTYETSPGKND
ncbi:MAG: hypothetical protein JWM16_7, partial [Verrucomicrobiales bacterium]|nr:hypothetical protein [Verrucomicrobiales bacterium]